MTFLKSTGFTVCVLAFSLVFGSGGFAEEAPSAFDAIAKDIQTAVKALEYPEEVGQDLVKMVHGWKCVEWKQKLSQAKQDLTEKKISTDQAAQIEEAVAKELFEQIGKEIAYDDDLYKFVLLTEVLSQKKATSPGFAQLYSIVGNAVGLSMKIVYAFEPPGEVLPSKKRHLNCCVDLGDGRSIMIDHACGVISKPFVMHDEFTEDGNYCEAKGKEIPGIHGRIQIWENSALASIIYLYRGQQIKAPEQTKDALACFAKAVERNPKYVLAYANRALAYSRLGQRAEALADASKAVELDPKSPEAYCTRGAVYCEANKYPEAILEFEKSIALNQKYARAYYSRGTALVRTEKQAEALADFEKCIEIDPKFASGYYGRGRIELTLGKIEEAKKDLLKAVELEPAMKASVQAISDAYQLDLFPIL